MNNGQWVPTTNGGHIWVPDYKWWYIKHLIHLGWQYSGTYIDLRFVDIEP